MKEIMKGIYLKVEILKAETIDSTEIIIEMTL
jgi:hypothetical protein